MTPSDLRYTKTHEWVRVETDASGAKIGVVGITDYAVQSLHDLTFLELPQVGQQVEHDAKMGEVESVKAVSDLNSPVDGEVIEVNAALPDNLALLSEDPYGRGWLAKVRLADASPLDALLDAAAYQKQCEQEMDES